MKTNKKGLHEWSKNDTILTLYVTKFGTKGIYLKSESDVSKFIGSSMGSLKMQMANFKFLMGFNQNSLSDFSKLQKEVFDEFNHLSQFDLLKVVKKIIGQDQVELKELFQKMGKDFSKMKKVEI
jgi:hypothetical protein